MTKMLKKTGEKEKIRALRNETPRAEVLVWAKLRQKQVMGYRFRRQYSVGPYVLDFYCPSLKLGVQGSNL